MNRAGSRPQERTTWVSWPGIFALVPWLLILVGIVFRLGRYLANRALWLDEAALALNIATRSFGRLLGPLDYNQAAPAGFLILEKLALRWLGPSEYALRLLPMIAAFYSIPLFFLLTKQLLAERARVVAMCIFGASEPLIDYASEVKQYSSDVLITIGILALTIQSLQHGLSGRRYIGLILVGAIAPWLSYPAVFVLTGAAVSLIARENSQGNRSSAYQALSLAAIWGFSFVLNYTLFGRNAASNRRLLDFWASEFAPLPTSAAGAMWYIKVAFRCFKDIFGSPAAVPELGPVLSGLALVAALAGVGNLFESGRWTLTTLLMPIGLTALASAMKFYPFSGRLLLFLSPIFILLIAAGTQEISRNTGPTARMARWGAALLAIAPLAIASTALLSPPGKQETRKVLSYLSEHARGGDLVYLYPGFQPAVDYYRRFSKIAGLSELTFVEGDPGQWPAFEADLEWLRGRSRVWVFFCRTTPDHGANEHEVVLSAFDKRGKRVDEFHQTGAMVYLYDLSARGRE